MVAGAAGALPYARPQPLSTEESPLHAPGEPASDELRLWLETAHRAAAAAARVHGEALGRVGMAAATEKTGNDFVSEVDLASQAAALSVIRDRHPDHAILAEEQEPASRTPARQGPLWIVDPLDGTTNFLHGHPVFAASVGVRAEGRFAVGAVHAAATGERWWAARGLGAWFAGPGSGAPVRIGVSETATLPAALVATGFPFKAPDLIPAYVGQLERVLRATSGVRRCGAAAIDLCYLAQGRVDAFWELVLSVWDVAAGLAILEEAGGRASRIDGSALTLEAGDVLAANGPVLHEALAGLVRT